MLPSGPIAGAGSIAVAPNVSDAAMRQGLRAQRVQKQKEIRMEPRRQGDLKDLSCYLFLRPFSLCNERSGIFCVLGIAATKKPAVHPRVRGGNLLRRHRQKAQQPIFGKIIERNWRGFLKHPAVHPRVRGGICVFHVFFFVRIDTPKRIPPRAAMLSIRSAGHPESESRRAPPGAQRDSFANGASGVKFDTDMKHGLHMFRASKRFPPRTPGCTAGLLPASPDHSHKILPCASMLSIRSARHAGHSGINTTSSA